MPYSNDADPLILQNISGSRRQSIVVIVVIVTLSIPSRCLPDGQIDDDDGDKSNDGNDTGPAAEISKKILGST